VYFRTQTIQGKPFNQKIVSMIISKFIKKEYSIIDYQTLLENDIVKNVEYPKKDDEDDKGDKDDTDDMNLPF
jgi:hypothetical protein